MRTVRSFDPYLPCGMHVSLGNGKTLERLHTPTQSPAVDGHRADRPETPERDAQWRTAGDRIQTLLDSCAAGGAAAYERAQQLVREVVGLYGAGLERIVQLSRDPGMTERLATDDLVASLLLVHGLHPHDLRRRVSDALDRVRPYLGSHGGDVHLLDIDGDTVQLQFAGSCKSC